MAAKRRQYTAAFKREAVALVAEKGRSCRAVERELGLSEGVVYRWVGAMRKDPVNSFPGHGHLKPHEEAMRKLSRENEVLRRERDILKKAVAIFSKEPKRYTDS
jgi:transposase